MFDKWIRAWLVKCHGEGVEHQADFYRCRTCGRLVNWKKIYSGNTCCRGELIPANPRLFEKLRILVLPWTI